jgi:hypothetical protein
MWSDPSEPPSRMFRPSSPRMVSLKAEPIAFSIETNVSVLIPSAVTWPGRLIKTARGELA